MKKVKVMLTAITVFAVIGGALAFKAQKFGKTVYTTDVEQAEATCPFATPNFTLTTIDPGTPSISVTSVKDAFCILTYTKPQQ